MKFFRKLHDISLKKGCSFLKIECFFFFFFFFFIMSEIFFKIPGNFFKNCVKFYLNNQRFSYKITLKIRVTDTSIWVTDWVIDKLQMGHRWLSRSNRSHMKQDGSHISCTWVTDGSWVGLKRGIIGSLTATLGPKWVIHWLYLWVYTLMERYSCSSPVSI